MVPKVIREKAKRLPLVGPWLYDAYLRAFFMQGEILRIQSGQLKDRKWIRFMHTYQDDYIRGDYEQSIQAVLTKNLAPGMTFFDIGANGGFFSLLGASLVGAEGRVIAFEPQEHIARLCRKQMAINEIQCVEVIVAAVTDYVGTAKFSTDMGSVSNRILADTSNRGAVEVPAVRLDDLDFLPPPSLIKIDAEGAELKVINGARTLIKKHLPILVVELHRESRTAYEPLMCEMGYATDIIDGNHVVSRPVR